jgi:hypothetical protein
MDPCPVSKGGRHALASIVPTEDADMDVTLYCERCGMVRRFRVNGPLVPDSAEGAEIAKRTTP